MQCLLRSICCEVGGEEIVVCRSDYYQNDPEVKVRTEFYFRICVIFLLLAAKKNKFQ